VGGNAGRLVLARAVELRDVVDGQELVVDVAVGLGDDGLDLRVLPLERVDLRAVGLAERALLLQSRARPGQEKCDSSSLQRECAARARSV
jgi:hypothetical protein